MYGQISFWFERETLQKQTQQYRHSRERSEEDEAREREGGRGDGLSGGSGEETCY